MLYPTKEDWETWGIEDECHRFFVLHWHELFDAETPDTWQVRTCNIATLLEEMIDAARIAEGYDPYRGVLRSILDETFPVVKRDTVLKEYYPFVASYLHPWEKKEIGKDQPAEVLRLATVILGNLRDYWENAVELVLRMLRAADKRKKKELYDATMNMGVATVTRGRSPSFLIDAVKAKVLCKSEVTFLERVEGMFRDFAQVEEEYDCLFWTDGVKRHLAEKLPDDIKLRFGRPESVAAGSPAERFYESASKFQIFLNVKTTATDPEAAWRAADQRLGEVFAGLNLFNLDGRYRVKPIGSLVRDSTGLETIAGHRTLGTEYLGSYDSRQTKAEMLFRVLNRLEGQNRAQLSAAIQYHRLALQATSDEARLLNLWIALEGLCQGDDGSIIGRVCTLISPCVSVENVQKNLTSLAIYVRFLWDESDVAQFLELFPRSTEDTLEPGDLVDLLLLPKTHEKIKKFCKLCAKHPLILHRLYRTKMMTLEGPSSVADNLVFTNQNVVWQLKRIYRVRNAIVHSGRGSALLPQLTQHLHCYLVKAIKSILEELDRNPNWGIRDALEHRRLLFDHVVTLFKNGKGHEISASTILEPHACMAPQREPFAWPEAEKPEEAPAQALTSAPRDVLAAATETTQEGQQPDESPQPASTQLGEVKP